MPGPHTAPSDTPAPRAALVPAAYWWSWGERIGPLHDPPAAARKISAVLRAVPEPSHG